MTEPEFYLTMAVDLRAMSVKEAQELLEYMKKNKIVKYHARYIRLKRNEKKVAKKSVPKKKESDEEYFKRHVGVYSVGSNGTLNRWM